MRNRELGSWFTHQGPIPIPNSETTVNTVFGIKASPELPVRFLWGFIPGIGLVEHFISNNIPTTMRVFVPQHIAETINHLDPETTAQNRNLGIAIIKQFIDLFHPDITVAFDVDKPITPAAIEILKPLALLLQQHPTAEVSQIINLGHKHNEEVIPNLMYAAHHLFGWQDMVHISFFNSSPSITVVNCLPPTEKPFAAIRRHLVNLVVQENSELIQLIHSGSSLDIFTVAAKKAHYLLISGEPTIQQVATHPRGEMWALDELDARIALEPNQSIKANFKKAKRDLQQIISQIEKRRSLNPNLPNLTELLQEVLA